MNDGAVISNPETNEKLGVHSKHFLPKASILDPEYTYSLPTIQTAAGTADIMSHVIEQYFNSTTGTYIQDRFCEGILETCIKYCPVMPYPVPAAAARKSPYICPWPSPDTAPTFPGPRHRP